MQTLKNDINLAFMQTSGNMMLNYILHYKMLKLLECVLSVH